MSSQRSAQHGVGPSSQDSTVASFAISPRRGRASRIGSALMLLVPTAALVVGVLRAAPQPLAVALVWAFVAWHEPRAGNLVERLVPALPIQVRRFAIAASLIVVLGSAGLSWLLVGLTAFTIDHGPSIVLALIAATVAFGVLGAGLRERGAARRAPVAEVGLSRREPGQASKLLPRPLALGIGCTGVILALLDRWALFQYTLFLAVLVGLGLLLGCGGVNAIRAVRGHGERELLATRLAILWLASLLILFVATLKLSALGCYDLVQLADRSQRHELLPSPRARINSFGFRGPERALTKAPGTLRVAVLGDSLSYGWFVNEEATFARRLEVLLRVDFPDAGIEVINAAVPAYSLAMMHARYLARVQPHRPDWVVIVDGGNRDGASLGDYEKELRATLASIRDAGAEPVLCAYPDPLETHPSAEEDGVKKRLSAQLGIPLVDLGAVAEHLGERFFQPDRHHATPLGHAALAAALEPTLRREIARHLSSAGSPP